MVVQSQVAQKHRSRKDHSARVRLVLALDVKTNVTAAWLEHSNVTAHVATRDNTRSTHKGRPNVGENATVQVGHNHNVELLGARNSLHGGVVDDHVVNLQSRVVLGDLVEGAAEKAIRKLHDVGLVDAGNLLAVVGKSETKGELGNALGFGASDNLQGLHNTLHGLVFETRVFTFGVLTDNAKINILVTGLVAGDVLDEDDRGENIELLTESNVERLVAGALNWGKEDTLQTQLVTAQRSNGLLEKLFRVLVTGVNTANIYLLPLDGNIVGLEDSLDRLSNLGTDSVTFMKANHRGISKLIKLRKRRV